MHHPRQYPAVSKTHPTLGSHSRKQNHTQAYADNSHLWWPSDSLRWHLAGEVSVCVSVDDVRLFHQTVVHNGLGVPDNCGADVPTATKASWMDTVVMLMGKCVGGLAYALPSSEWLEFNTDNNVSSLLCFLCHSLSFLLFLLWASNHSPVCVAIAVSCDRDFLTVYNCYQASKKKVCIGVWLTYNIKAN